MSILAGRPPGADPDDPAQLFLPGLALILFFAVVGGALGALGADCTTAWKPIASTIRRRLRALAAEISLAEERERHRLATELHEHVGQILAVAQIKMGTLAPEVKSRPAWRRCRRPGSMWRRPSGTSGP